jgi:acylphosphatase
MIRYHLRFTGQVQGVGFRWTATRAANVLGLTGWVYNAWDGSVEMEVQGDEQSIDQMIAAIDR